MNSLRIQRHGRLQDAVAEHLGLFRDQNLDAEFVDHRVRGQPTTVQQKYKKLWLPDSSSLSSAYRDFVLSGTVSHITATSNWAVNAAVASGYGALWPHAYSIMPAGIYVGPNSDIRFLRELVDREIVVGRHSGSHFAALYALRRLLPESSPKLRFVEGKESRLKYMLGSADIAGSMYGVDSYVLEANGYRKLIDTSFIVTFMVAGDPPGESVKKYFEALRSAQLAIDEDPERYKPFLVRELPEYLRANFEPYSFGIGERMIFEDYSIDMAGRSLEWLTTEQILPSSWIA